LAAVLRAVAGEVPGTSRLIVNEVTNRFTATFGYFLDTQEQQAPFRSRRVVYSTMKGQDVALVELEATYGELVCRGYRPLELASEAPASDEAVLVTGIPSRDIPPLEYPVRIASGGAGSEPRYELRIADAGPGEVLPRRRRV
jgi:hypothetical protein